VNADPYADPAVNAIFCAATTVNAFLMLFGCLAVNGVSYAARGVTAVSIEFGF
jgi:hypothetical protein